MARALQIGLVNNMPDTALQATERQFRALLEAAGGEQPVRLKLFHLPEIARGEVGRRHMARNGYATLDDLPAEGLDALIVTGAEPLTARLQDEAYWGSMCELVDWAERHTRSTIWSCLAAHAAVLRLDGIERRKLAAKCSGVFPFARMVEHPLTEGMGEAVLTPHSRTNGLPAEALSNAGYAFLTASAEVGVDAFVREGESRFVFMHGHPEYDADALRLEYRRDIKRFLNGEAAVLPQPPHGAFEPSTVAALAELAECSAANPHPDRFDAYAQVLAVPRAEAVWRPAWRRFYANWIESLTPAPVWAAIPAEVSPAHLIN
jgi:homoserine O-succinyltransferase/O-acetyltransferase